MTEATISGVRVAGIASAVPAKRVGVEEGVRTFGEEALKIGEATGIRARRVADKATCTSDLCFVSAQRLLQSLEWDPQSVGALVFVSQTPDYLLPATSCILQARLNLPKTCVAFDVNLGCSGYVYGLWIASSLMRASGLKRVLLLAGDTMTRLVSPDDRSTALIFGDAGTATALEASAADATASFSLGADGGGQESLIVREGGFRNPRRGSPRLHMDGPEVFAFTSREVVPSIRAAVAAAGWTLESVDSVVLHQANQFLVQHLAKKLKLPPSKVPIAMDGFGNTSVASIPLALTTHVGERLRRESLRVVLSGFGVGWSWGAVACSMGPIVVPELVELDAIGAN